MAGEKSLSSDFSQSTVKAKNCEPSKKQRVRCCSFLPALGKPPLQKMRLRWSERCDGSRRSNTDFCRGCCSGHCVWDVLRLLDCILALLSLPELAELKLE